VLSAEDVPYKATLVFNAGYGAADTVICLATANVEELVRLCAKP
jgi:predicted GH43/DUF377 family glycosyl hydrolase